MIELVADQGRDAGEVRPETVRGIVVRAAAEIVFVIWTLALLSVEHVILNAEMDEVAFLRIPDGLDRNAGMKKITQKVARVAGLLFFRRSEVANECADIRVESENVAAASPFFAVEAIE